MLSGDCLNHHSSAQGPPKPHYGYSNISMLHVFMHGIPGGAKGYLQSHTMDTRDIHITRVYAWDTMWCQGLTSQPHTYDVP